MRTSFFRHTCTFVAVLLMLAGCDSAGEVDESGSAATATQVARGEQQRLTFRPNILWLVAEDLSPIMPPFGDSTVATPNLSRLAAEGVRYTHFFSPSGVCAPSRAAIATGMYPTAIAAQHMRTGPWWNGRPPAEQVAAASEQMGPGLQAYEAIPPPEARMLSEYLRLNGYFASNNRKQDYQFVAPVTAWDENGRDAHWLHRQPGQPFYAVFNFNVTHESQIWQKANDSLLVARDLDVPVPPYLQDTETSRTDIRRVYSNMIEMDRAVGERLSELESYGLLDSTIVVWYTDHGGPLPRQKRALYDSGLRVPLIIRYPEAWRAGEVDDRLISFIDLLPTTLSLINMQPPPHVHGRAFEGAWADTSWRTHVFAAADRFDEATDTRRAVRDARYKYIRNLQPETSAYLPLSYRENIPTMREMLRLRDTSGLTPIQARWFAPTKPPEELYDTRSDPHEVDNVVADSAYSEVLASLRVAYERWQTEVPDLGLMDERDLLEKLWPDGTQPATEPPVAEVADNTIELTSKTVGARIGFRILPQSDEVGATTGAWSIYDGPITVPPDSKVVAVAHRIGFLPSELRSYSPHQ